MSPRTEIKPAKPRGGVWRKRRFPATPGLRGSTAGPFSASLAESAACRLPRRGGWLPAPKKNASGAFPPGRWGGDPPHPPDPLPATWAGAQGHQFSGSPRPARHPASGSAFAWNGLMAKKSKPPPTHPPKQSISPEFVVVRAIAKYPARVRDHQVSEPLDTARLEHGSGTPYVPLRAKKGLCKGLGWKGRCHARAGPEQELQKEPFQLEWLA